MKKILSAAIAAAILTSYVQAAEYKAAVTSMTVVDGKLQSMTVEKSVENSATGIAAVYDSEGRLIRMVFSEDDLSGIGEKSVSFSQVLTVGTDEILKGFIWQNNGNSIIEPMSEYVVWNGEEVTVEPTEEVTEEPTTEPTEEVTLEPTTDTTVGPAGDGVIHLLGTEVDATGVEGVTVSGTTVTITEPGEYTVEGTLDEGQIVVSSLNASDKITVNLDNVNVTSVSNDPFSGKKGKVTLVPLSGTENTFNTTDGAAINVKNDLTIKGEGKINAISQNGNGIRSKSDLEIGVCDVYVKAGNNGIKGDKSVKITKKNKSVTIESVNDGIKSDTAPITVDSETGEVIGGTVTINGGEITITTGTETDEITGEVSAGDGIQADTLLTISGGTLKINAAGEGLKANASSIEHYEDSTAEETLSDGDGKIIISGGAVEIAAGEDAVKAVKKVYISGGDITITKGLEGIQVNEVIYDTDGETVLYLVDGEIEVSGGNVDITCSEDGIQCGTGNVTIADGTVKIDSYMDAIQAENVLSISGGVFDIVTYGGSPATASEKNPEAANSCKGLKAGKLVDISGGKFNIDSYDDAIHSNSTVKISGGDIDASTGDDGVHGDSYLYISDEADINITKSYEGIEAAEIYISGGITRVVSTDDGANAAGEKPTAEGAVLSAVSEENNVYSKGRPNRNGNRKIRGASRAVSADDGVNAASEKNTSESAVLYAMPGGNNVGSNGGFNGGGNWGREDTSNYGYLEVSGGILYIEAEGDGFDSNGSALISGGYVFVNGPTSGGNGVFDIGDNSGDKLHITGGVVIGAGTSDMPVTPDTDTGSQAYVVASGGSSWGFRPGGSASQSGFTSQSAGKAFKLCDQSGSEIVTYVPSKTHSWVFVSTPEMISGNAYTLYYGGSVTDGTFTGSADGRYGLVIGGTYNGSSSTVLTATK